MPALFQGTNVSPHRLPGETYYMYMNYKRTDKPVLPTNMVPGILMKLPGEVLQRKARSCPDAVALFQEKPGNSAQNQCNSGLCNEEHRAGFRLHKSK